MFTRVKRIFGTNEEEFPFLLVVPFGKEGADGVDCSLNPRLEAYADLRITAGIFRLGAVYFQTAFCE